MKLDTPLRTMGTLEAGALARRCEERGHDGVWTVEAGRDPFPPLLAAAQEPRRIQLGTNIAVAAKPSELPAAFRKRYEGVLDRVALYFPIGAEGALARVHQSVSRGGLSMGDREATWT